MSSARKLRLATIWLGGWSGCHMSFLDLDEWLFELARRVEVVYSPLINVKTFPADVDLTLVEGAVANEDNLALIKTARANSKLVIATGQNNAAINAAVLHTARHYVHGFAHEDIPEGLLNRVEASVRAYDPCLSCSTHAVGQMPLQIDIFDASGAQVRSLTRGVQSS
jgi:Ni,Fe-hydrogenase III small subunit